LAQAISNTNATAPNSACNRRRKSPANLSPSGKRFGIGLLNAPRDQIQFFPRAFNGSAWLQPPDDIDGAHSLSPQLIFLVEAKREPQLRLAAELKPGWHHADDQAAFAFERQRLSDDVRIAAEPPLP
jgi:hypothetical protein